MVFPVQKSSFIGNGGLHPRRSFAEQGARLLDSFTSTESCSTSFLTSIHENDAHKKQETRFKVASLVAVEWSTIVWATAAWRVRLTRNRMTRVTLYCFLNICTLSALLTFGSSLTPSPRFCSFFQTKVEVLP